MWINKYKKMEISSKVEEQSNINLGKMIKSNYILTKILSLLEKTK